MRIDIVFPKLPPALDGIGDHTALLASALGAAGHDVRILTAQEEVEPIAGVEVEEAFTMRHRNGVDAIEAAVKSDLPDWIFVQFNQFSYGRWGLNPYLPLVLRRIKRRHPQVRIAVMFHEDFVPLASVKFAVMTTWQRAQFWSLGDTADVVLFSIEPWVRKYQSWFPDTPVYHLPVGSNIPHVGVSREEARTRLGIGHETFLVGVFGSAHGSRLLNHVRRAALAIRKRISDTAVLYVGPHGDAMREVMGRMPLIDAGRKPAEDVSIHLSAMDVHLAPFVDGVSTRRGSFMAGLQHALPTLSTCGPLTDPLLLERNGHAFRLTSVGDAEGFEAAGVELALDDAMRKRFSTRARVFYDSNFAWEVLADRVVDSLSIHGKPLGVL